MKSDKKRRNKAAPSSDRIKSPLELLEQWAVKRAEARAKVHQALNGEKKNQSASISTPGHITDPLLMLEYWVARTGESRARMEQHMELAKLNYNMEIALQESAEMVKRLDEALKYSPDAKDTLMNGNLF